MRSFRITDVVMLSCLLPTLLCCAVHSMLGQDAPLVLVDNGVAKARIVVGADVPPAAKFAAKELQTYIKKSTGAELPIEAALGDGKDVDIVIGDGKLSQELGVNSKELSRDASIIKTVGRRLVILGKDDPTTTIERMIVIPSSNMNHFEHVTLFGVYEFLERFVGVRWYLPGDVGEVVPKRGTLAVPAVSLIDAPRKLGRYTQYLNGADDCDDPLPKTKTGGYTPGFDKDKAKEFTMRRNLWGLRLRHQTTMVTGNHTMHAIVSMKKFAKERPDFFALYEDGKRSCDENDELHTHVCFTNDDMIQHVINAAKAAFRGETSEIIGQRAWGGVVRDSKWGKAFHIGQCDAYQACVCKRCEDFRAATGLPAAAAESELVWSAIIKVAEAVKNEFPNCVISTWTYGPLGIPPQKKIPENVIIGGLKAKGPYGEFVNGLESEAKENIAKWSKAVGEERLGGFLDYAMSDGWENGVYASSPGICGSIPRAYAAAYKKLANVGQGTYLYMLPHRIAFAHLNLYTFYKYHWSPERNVDDFLKEYYTLFYGPAAEPMGTFWDEVETQFRKVMSKVVETPVGPQGVMVDELQLWGEIYGSKTIDRWKGYFDQAGKLAQAAKDPIYAQRIDYMRRNVLEAVIDDCGQHDYIAAAAQGVKNNPHPLPKTIKNPSFEEPISENHDNTGNWDVYYNRNVNGVTERDASEHADGSWSIVVKGSGGMVGALQYLKLVAGGWYRLSFQYKTTPTAGASWQFYGHFINKKNEKAPWQKREPLPPAPDWRKAEIEFCAPPSVAGKTGNFQQLSITLLGRNKVDTDRVWFDDVKLEALYEPPKE